MQERVASTVGREPTVSELDSFLFLTSLTTEFDGKFVLEEEVTSSDSLATAAAEPDVPAIEATKKEQASVSTRTRSRSGSATMKERKPIQRSNGGGTGRRSKQLPPTKAARKIVPSRFPKTLWPRFWLMGGAGEPCNFTNCRFAKGAKKIAARRHFHPRCCHTHKTGENAGLKFATSQKEKAEKHQRLHPEYKK